MSSVHHHIRTDTQIWKFCFYGFFKNLKFFEPFLLIFLLAEGLSLFEIGILYSVREFITYVFEIPSGIIADNYGRRKELIICFIFYIASFATFYVGTNLPAFIMAMALFGFGEAFRSGTHKAMIYTYLERKGWFEKKDFVYGRTRSFSLIGSAVSSILAAGIAVYSGELRILFLFCIIPYVIDFALILSYPKYFDAAVPRKFSVSDFKHLSVGHMKSIWGNRSALKTIVSSSIFDSIFKSVKDYIQPILQTVVASIAVAFVFDVSQENALKIILGAVYSLIYIVSSIASKNSYKIKRFGSAGKMMNSIFLMFAFLSVLLSLFIYREWVYLTIFLFVLLFVLQNIRRPVYVDVIGDFMKKNERATVLSVESQLKSLWIVLLAPAFGFVADTFSIPALFLGLGVFMIILSGLIRVPESAQ